MKIESGSTEQRHRFRVHRPPLKLRLKMERCYNTPLKNAECELLVDFDSTLTTTDGEGTLETNLPRNAVNAHLTVTDSITLKGRQMPLPIRLRLRIGYLNPLDEPSGQKARLSNLGYYRASVDEVDDDIDDDEFQSAVEEFQCEHALTVDGKCGGQTQAKLKEIHGC